ncbi:MAG: LytR/AlgR family response regulator transcription factor [Emticicia sp.]|uniref:LytR/AlgR family response regulator transcription factor n=1 Tax=Emticicia sp. TaxID=1930953 RepID=UPI003BA7B842
MKNLDHTSNCIVDKNKERKRKQIKLHYSNKFVSVPVEKIVRLEGDCNYTVVYTQTKRYISARTLKHYEEILDNSIFIRVHKSHLINIRYAKSINVEPNNNAIAFDGGSNIEISRRKVKTVIEKFAFYKNS